MSYGQNILCVFVFLLILIAYGKFNKLIIIILQNSNNLFIPNSGYKGSVKNFV